MNAHNPDTAHGQQLEPEAQPVMQQRNIRPRLASVDALDGIAAAAKAAAEKRADDRLARTALAMNLVRSIERQKGIDHATLHSAQTLMSVLVHIEQFHAEDAPRMIEPFLSAEMGIGFAPLPAPQSGDDGAKQAEGK